MVRIEHVKRVNREVLKRINRDIMLTASRFANTLLAGVFRAIFSIEKGYEFAEPELYQPDYDPERILWRRLNPWQMKNLAIAIANEEVMASRYQVFTEYDFVVVVDVSQSMMLDWWSYYGGETMPGTESRPLPTNVVPGDRTKLCLLKYTVASFLAAARSNDFFSSVLLAGGGKVRHYDSRRESHLDETLLNHIDDQYLQMVRTRRREAPSLPEALKQVSAHRRRAIVLCVSDFTDLLAYPRDRTARVASNQVLLPLVQTAAQHRVLTLQIVDRTEVDPPPADQDWRGEVKDTPFLNAETFERNKVDSLSKHMLRKHAERTALWSAELRRNFARYGIKFEQLVAGRDDQRVDKKIHDLGIATGA